MQQNPHVQNESVSSTTDKTSQSPNSTMEGEEGSKFVNRIDLGNYMTTISIVVQRGNAVAILGCASSMVPDAISGKLRPMNYWPLFCILIVILPTTVPTECL